MGFISSLVILFSSALSTAAIGAMVPLAIDQAYVPTQFDSNDRTTFMVTSSSKNSCHFQPKTTTEVNRQKNQILVGFFVNEGEGSCLETKQKFKQLVEVGKLAEGEYQIFDGSNLKPIGSLNVSKKNHARPGPDAYPYAPVKEVNVVLDKTKNRWALSLSGEFEKECDGLKEVRISTEGKNVIEVVPISFSPHHLKCKENKTPFIKTEFIEELKRGDYLVHVRLPEGRSLNRMIHVQ